MYFINDEYLFLKWSFFTWSCIRHSLVKFHANICQKNFTGISNKQKFSKSSSQDAKEAILTSKQKIENGIQSKSFQASGDLPHCTLDDVLQLSQFGTIVYHQSSGEGSIYVAYDPMEKYLGNGCTGHQSVACQILDLKFRNPSSSPPWCLSLGLDLNLEARSQHPPSNFMYTFLCCQVCFVGFFM